jgi:hypothetical protein
LACKLFTENLRVELPKMPKMVESACSTINLIYSSQRKEK